MNLWWVLPDNNSTVNALFNPKIIHNIRQEEGDMHMQYNTGIRNTNLMGTMPGFGDMWFDPE